MGDNRPPKKPRRRCQLCLARGGRRDFGSFTHHGARVIGGWMWPLFPSLLAAMKSPAPRQQIVRSLFGISAKVRQKRAREAVKARG